jgi:hypothetical protein
MGTLLQFQTKAEREAGTPLPVLPPQTPPELYKDLYSTTLVHCRELVALYRKTGKWNPECEEDMIRVVQQLQLICARLAGPTGDSDGKENIG